MRLDLLDMASSNLIESVVEGKADFDKPIDREKEGKVFCRKDCLIKSAHETDFVDTIIEKISSTCPLLLRVFLSTGRHHSLSEYTRGNVPSNELQIYTWLDATLKELTSLVKEVNPDLRRKGTYFDFALVFPDIRGPGYRMRDIGTTCSGQKSSDDSKTLSECRFKIGDYLDIAVSPPALSRPRGSRSRRQNMY